MNNNIEKLDTNECCGCGSCMQKCPKGAIEMVENEEGFIVPRINKDICVNCGLCVKACPQLNYKREKIEGYPQAFAIYNKNEEELLKSSSGGVFSVIANYVLKNNGVVFGAAYNEKNEVEHIEVADKNSLGRLNKSKYIQSNTKTTFKEVEKYLKSDKYVLYTGTPCQINGLKNFLGKDYEKLILCDIVCHGVPSVKAFKQYINYLEKKNKAKIKSYDFRTKDKTADEKMSKVEFDNGKRKYIKYSIDPYYSNFLQGNIFRESCYTCKYSNMDRVGDITIGDYIGILQVEPNLYNKYGISICIVNNEKGNKLLSKLDEKVVKSHTKIDNVKKYNSNLNKPVKRPNVRDNIYKNIDNESEFIKDLKVNIDINQYIKAMIPIKIKNFVKKVGGKIK